MRTLDNDKLIACVLSRPAIWDKREKSHSNRSLVDRCWKEIAGEMDVDENALRKKWKYLREQFCVELGKISLVCSGDEGSNSDSTKWPYFRSLMFLKEVVKPRVLSANSNLFMTVHVDPASLTDRSGELKDESQDANCPEDQGSEPESAHSQQEASIQLPLAKTRKRGCPSENISSYDIENKRLLKTNEEKEQCDEEDLLFFRSLLPHVRNIHPAQKLLLRSKILGVVSQFVYPQARSAPTYSHYSYSDGFKQNNLTQHFSPHHESD